MTSSSRTIAIGDIHGCSLALKTLLDAVRPGPHDLIITLGDYIDRGPDSKGVVEQLVQLGRQCNLVSILGNHDEMFLHVIRSVHPASLFISMGGMATLKSYGTGMPPDFSVVPRDHVEFLEGCVDYFETESHIFLHASYMPNRPMAEQPNLALQWESIRDSTPHPHVSGKTVIVGHTSQRGGEVLDAGHLKCIDTYCYGGGWLTALDVHSGELWQTHRDGRLRGRDP